MKKVLFTIMAFISIMISNAQSWTTLISGSTSNLKSVHFPTTNIGYAVGDQGSILKTTNSGASWSGLTSSYPGYWFWDVHFISADTGYVCGETDPGSGPAGFGMIIKTIDGGLNWTSCISGSPFPIRDLFVLNKDTIFACGGSEGINGKIIKSLNGGSSWTPIGLTYNDAMLGGLCFLNSNTGFLGVYESVFGTYNPTKASWLNTIDGMSFTTIVSSPYGYWNFATDFPDQSTGYMTRSTYAGDPAYLRKTTDGGITWTENIISGTNNIYAIDFINSNTGYIVGDGGVIKNTMDGGTTWTSETSGTTEDLRSVFLVNTGLGFAAGNNGKILKYTATAMDISDPNPSINPMVIFPNPNNGFFQIKNIKNNDKMEVFNTKGQLLLSKIDLANNSIVDLTSFAAGLYTVVVTNNKGVYTSKFLKQ